MTERPILFSAEMVRAILAGRKTQTRRKMKPQPKPTPADYPAPAGHLWPSKLHHSMLHVEQEMQKWNGLAGSACPYGALGDMLWVREAFRYFPETGSHLWDGDREYQADGAVKSGRFFTAEEWQSRGIKAKPEPRWRPSIHMPRWASRITLEVKSVRVERLQDISEDDARAEGCEARPFPGPWWQGYRDLGNGEMLHQQAIGETPPDWMIEPKKMPPTPWLDQSARDGFRSIWMDLHGPGAWDDNPWVWVIEFERVKP